MQSVHVPSPAHGASRRAIAASFRRRAALSTGAFAPVSASSSRRVIVPASGAPAPPGRGRSVRLPHAGATSDPANMTPHESALAGSDMTNINAPEGAGIRFRSSSAWLCRRGHSERAAAVPAVVPGERASASEARTHTPCPHDTLRSMGPRLRGDDSNSYSSPSSRNSRRICSGILAAPGAARDRSRGASLASR